MFNFVSEKALILHKTMYDVHALYVGLKQEVIFINTAL